MRFKLKHGNTWTRAAGAAFLALGAFAPNAMAADHRDSLSVDALPEGDFTDVFAYLDPANPGNVILSMMVNPFTNPSQTPSERFAHEYLYQFKINNNSANGATEDLVVQIDFSAGRGAQTYQAVLGTPAQTGTLNRRLANGTELCTPVAGGVAPVYIGSVGSAPAVVTMAEAIVETTAGGKCFAGVQDDSFQTDVAQAVFRMGLNPDPVANANNRDQDLFRGYAGLQSLLGGLRGRPLRADGSSGVDGFGGYSGTAVAISIPKNLLRGTGIPDVSNNGNNNAALIGVWGTVSRPAAESFDGFTSHEESEEYAQFERMGQQLFNTVFVFQQPVVNGEAALTRAAFQAACPSGPALGGNPNALLTTAELKDLANAVSAECDAPLYDRYFPDSLTTTPTGPAPTGGLGGLLGGLSNLLFGGGNTVAGRASLLTILGFNSVGLTGTPLLLPQIGLQNNSNRRLNAQLSIPDYMRLNLDQATDGVRAGAATAGNSSATLAVGRWGLQNGRRPADDVTDIILRLNRELDDVKFPDNFVLPGLVNVIPGAGPLENRRALNCNQLAISGSQDLGNILAPIVGLNVNALLQPGASDGLLGRYTLNVLTPCEDTRIFAVLQGTDWIEVNPLDVNNVANQVAAERPLGLSFPYFGVNPVPGEIGTSHFPAQK